MGCEWIFSLIADSVMMMEVVDGQELNNAVNCSANYTN